MMLLKLFLERQRDPIQITEKRKVGVQNSD